MKKRVLVVLVIAVALCLALATAALAEAKIIILKIGDPNMTVDGVTKEIDPGRGTKPLVVSSRTLVPIRTIIENMGGTIAWDQDLQTVTISASNKTIKLVIGSKTAQVRDTSVADVWSSSALDVPAMVINGRTMVPIRFVTETLGSKVDYVNATKMITITLGVAAFDPLNWTGSWTTANGTLTLNQSGTVVTGSSVYWGQINGTVSGKVFTGTWYKSVSDQGELVMTISDDGKSMTGKWRYNYPGYNVPDDADGGGWEENNPVGQR